MSTNESNTQKTERTGETSEEKKFRFERTGEIPLYDLTVTVDELDRRILEQEAEDPDRWISQAIRLFFSTDNVHEDGLPSEHELRQQLDEDN